MFAFALLLTCPSPAQTAGDPRALYDVRAYHLRLRVEPATKTLRGSVTVAAEVAGEGLRTVVLDLTDDWTVDAVRAGERTLSFSRARARLLAELPAELPHGASFEVTVDYHGQPTNRDGFTGFHWARTADGQPWVNTSCQGPGAHSWWPCKASYFHPEDKPDRLRVDLTVPEGLYAVSNGRLEGVEPADEGWQTYRWAHDYPLETYSVTLNVAPYLVVESEIDGLPGLAEPLRWIYYVLPEDAAKAALQFRQVPELVRIYSEAFGPFPFPASKLAFVQTNFWGMEHSTAIAYGSSFPAWCAEQGERDAYASRNEWFDYILVHELAHEWWGNAVSASAWGHFWIHEGFASYAEGVYVERTQGREAADRFFQEQGAGVGKQSRLFRGAQVNSGDAYSGVLYAKGAAVLHTLRQYVDDDPAWWDVLREFQRRFRYRNASTEDFQAVLEERTGRDWTRFFQEWVYGDGYPAVSGRIGFQDGKIAVDLENQGSGGTGFHVPLTLEWEEGGLPQRRTLLVPPGRFHEEIPVSAPPANLRTAGFDRILGRHRIRCQNQG